MTYNETEDKTLNTEIEPEVEEDTQPMLDDDQIRAAALAYAKYLTDKGLAPGDATFVEPEELLPEDEDSSEEAQAEEAKETEKPADAPAEDEAQTDGKTEEKKKEEKPKKKTDKQVSLFSF